MVTTRFDLLEQNCYICIYVRQLWFTICKTGTVKQDRILGTGTFTGYTNLNPPPQSIAFSDGFIFVDLTEISEEEVSQVKPLHAITWR